MMELHRIILKILMWVLISGFGCNFVMQKISYSFYKSSKKMEEIHFTPEYIQFNEKLSGYGYNLISESNNIILFFGGSNYIAFNSVGSFGGEFDCPFISADFYGSQNSKGKMNLKSMQNTAIDLYDWTKINYPDKHIVVMGHSYGTGIAAYLASVRKCDSLILIAAYRDLSDLYNKIIPIFWGPAKVFISNDIRLNYYAQTANCNTYIIGSNSDKTLNASLQHKVKDCFANAEIKIFNGVNHENYLKNEQVIEFINEILQ
ncbi:alpha/beta fold hydrolase [Neobacillus sp. LXY-1]|uniref:alpha/beta fold hydrolase n=1 Tax=Neobacillus sp. LXY-1 TaxID=3379133 RepID=UPI003EE36284